MDSLDSRVHGDGNDVAQSRAVETVREALGGGHGKAATPMTGLRHVASAIHLGGGGGESEHRASGSLATERERRKSVKFGENTVQMLHDHSDGESRRQ